MSAPPIEEALDELARITRQWWHRLPTPDERNLVEAVTRAIAARPGVRVMKYAELRLWFSGRDPVSAPPDEIVGVTQESLEATQRFADAVLAVHWHGECGCQALAEVACTCPAGLYGPGHAEVCPRGTEHGKIARDTHPQATGASVRRRG